MAEPARDLSVREPAFHTWTSRNGGLLPISAVAAGSEPPLFQTASYAPTAWAWWLAASCSSVPLARMASNSA